MRVSDAWMASSVITIAALGLGCSTSAAPKANQVGAGGSSSGGTGSGGTAAGGSGAVGGSGVGGSIHVGDSGMEGDACTADLHGIVDASGNVIAQCPPDQGCFEGACIPACDAAALSKGNVGCVFLAPNPPFSGQGWPPDPTFATLPGPCHAAFVANAWTRPAQITVTAAGASYSLSQIGRIPKGAIPNVTYDPIPATGLPPDEVAILFLSHRPGSANGTSLECPVPPAVLQDTAVHGSGRGAAFEITTDTPVSAYAILPYGGAASYLPSATLLIPTTAWGTNYFALSPHTIPDPSQPGQAGVLWAALVGTVDGTTVQVAPPVTLPGGGGVSPANAGQATSYTINKGEIVQFLGADPSGAVIDADQPVGLFTGNTYLHIPSATATGGGHDASHQQIPHVGALGSEYVGAGVVTRIQGNAAESVPYRMLGVVDGTTLTYDPAPPPGAPTTLNAGQVAQFESTQFFSVSSDDAHPFLFTQYMTGTSLVPAPRSDCAGAMVIPTPIPIPGCGDEEWVNVLPPRQYLQKYVFFTDPTYATTNLVITRVATANGFEDVNVACLGPVTGWQPVGAGGRYEVAHVDLVRAGNAVASCNTSQHVAESNAPFGVTVWGTDWFASYAYPAGGNIGTINDVYVPPVPK